MLRDINFSEQFLPDTRELSNPFVTGLLFLKKAGISERNFSDFLKQLRVSRSEYQEIAFNTALTHGQPNSYESLVRFLLQTRALHGIEDLKAVYDWKIQLCCWTWAQIEQATIYLKNLDLTLIAATPPSDRKDYVLHFYIKSLQSAYPALFQN
jgi:hypothetical protein